MAQIKFKQAEMERQKRESDIVNEGVIISSRNRMNEIKSSYDHKFDMQRKKSYLIPRNIRKAPSVFEPHDHSKHDHLSDPHGPTWVDPYFA